MTEERWRKLFALKLEETMLRKGLNMTELSYYADIKMSTLYRYFHGGRIPRATTVLKLAYALDVDVSELIDFGEAVDDDPMDDFYDRFRPEKH